MLFDVLTGGGYELNEAYFNKAIHVLDFEDGQIEDAEAICGEISVTVDPTVTFDQMIDSIRKEDGWLPLFDCDGDYDEDGWYDYNVVITRNEATGIEATLGFSKERDTNVYEIPLTDDQRRWLFSAVKKQYCCGNELEWNKLWDRLEGVKTE